MLQSIGRPAADCNTKALIVHRLFSRAGPRHHEDCRTTPRRNGWRRGANSLSTHRIPRAPLVQPCSGSRVYVDGSERRLDTTRACRLSGRGALRVGATSQPTSCLILNSQGSEG